MAAEAAMTQPRDASPFERALVTGIARAGHEMLRGLFGLPYSTGRPLCSRHPAFAVGFCPICKMEAEKKERHAVLAEFLLERIAEDEEEARRISGQHWWAADHPADSWAVASDDGPVVYNEGAPTEPEAAHIARWDPARGTSRMRGQTAHHQAAQRRGR
ncbi:MAG TPA: DUF6221 family protein [Pseudonocardiaceae bacterium]|nr:DUF6221 family protein [Pseudonocardiaceae bacterium]